MQPIISTVEKPAVTLENCADEPIRIPGSIQRHGFLLGLDASQEHVVVASENVEEYLGRPLKLVLGAPLDLLLERELLGSLQQLRCSTDPDGMVSYVGSYPLRGDFFAVVTHCIEGKRILEFEKQERLVSAEMMNSVITNFVGTLSRLETQHELCEAVTQQVAQLTGFDRVLLYSFDDEGHGTVLTEANSGRLPSYLDLRFPATDIPKQARELYILNTVRIIPDAWYTPSPLRTVANDAPHILDLSLSVLRSVSPIHLQYMQNMGTAASMSISIVSEGRLWGLISCHHAEPRTVPFLVRSACDMLSKLAGTQLTSFRTAARLTTMVRFHGVQRKLLTTIAAERDYLAALAQQMDAIRDLADSNGAALWVDGSCESIGTLPDYADVQRIVDWLDTQMDTDIFVTRHLAADVPWAADFAATGSGLMAARISDVKQRYALWFRPEVVKTVTWAGAPAKPSDEKQLTPRTSFEGWKETLRGQSIRWSSEEMESAREFRSAIVTVVLKRVEEEAELSNARFEQLTHSLPIKIFTADDHGGITYTNQLWDGENLHTSGLWYANGLILPDDEARVAAAWNVAVATDESFEEEVRVPYPDGEPRWNLVRVKPFRRVGQRASGWVGIFIDLTERREREAALRMAEKLALTGRMTSVIAHEINNPLESITNLLYLVQQDIPAESPSAGYIRQAEGELERISGITKQTLRWNRENSSTPEVFTAGSIFDEVVRLFHGKIRNRMITVDAATGTEIQLSGIMGQVRQVVANLLSNALDASPLGGSVSMSAHILDTGGTVIDVCDAGTGMSVETLRQIFQPFYSTKGDLGNGLGLYISHEIAERHGGRLTADSTLGKGTTMRLTLPGRDATVQH